MREMASSFVLRAQAQAIYNPEEHRPFRPQPKRYAHFTSPIRRYSDLVVHRALIRRLGLGPDGLGADVGEAHLASLGEHLSRTERRAMEAERRAHERLVAHFMADRVGAVFRAQVTSVVYFGLFVSLEGSGAEGLVPVSTLGDEMSHARRTPPSAGRTAQRRELRAGRPGDVELVEADPVQGTLQFRLETHEPGHGAELARAAWKKGGPRRAPGRGRPSSRAPRRRS